MLSMHGRKLIVSLAVATLLLTSAAWAGPSLLVNGSFEEGPTVNGAGFVTVPSSGIDSSAIVGWSVGRPIDYVGSYWVASDGTKSLDMSASNVGSIGQAVATNVGELYTVEFDLAGNPMGGPADKRVQVSAAGVTQTFTFTNTPDTTRTNMGWTTETFKFVATDIETIITFQSLTAGACGPALDNVSVYAVPAPGGILLVGLGTSLVGWLRRRRAF